MPRSPALLLTALLLQPVTALSAQPQLTPAAQKALTQYKQDLQAALQAGMAQGLDEAISACNTQAPQIADRLSQEGIRLGRSSHRLRNPQSIPPDWAQPTLEDYLAHPETRLPRHVQLDNHRAGYIEPIVLKPLCTACHGTHLADPVATRLAELYPDDEATGFEPGDLRGIFWVEYTTAAP